MTKNKIAFAGFMGAILLSVGAANAATTTSVATKGYVDQEIKTVQASVNELQENSVSVTDVANAVNESIDELNLGETYEALANKVNSISAGMSAADKATKYPTVGAVLDAMPTLTEEDKKAIADLTGEDGLITRVSDVETAVETLTGEGDGSVAGQIASALAASQADWNQENANEADYIKNKPTGLITEDNLSEKLTAEGGVIADIQASVDDLDDAINNETNGLKTIVAENAADIADNAEAIAKNAEDIAKNTADIANKITMPDECRSPSSACVLMVTGGGEPFWTPVTAPVEDSVTTPVTGE